MLSRRRPARLVRQPAGDSAPGNVALTAGPAGVDRDCTVNVSQLLTLESGGPLA